MVCLGLKHGVAGLKAKEIHLAMAAPLKNVIPGITGNACRDSIDMIWAFFMPNWARPVPETKNLVLIFFFFLC